jgi:hypothetical protein
MDVFPNVGGGGGVGCGGNSYGDKNFSYSYGILYFLNGKVDKRDSIVFNKCDHNGQILYVHTTKAV